MQIKTGCAAVIAALWLLSVPAAAQDVTLTSRDGTLTIAGALNGYDGEFYRVMSEFGLLTLDAEGVICDGPGCPDLTTPFAEVRITGDAELGARLLPGLIAAFAASRGMGLETETGSRLMLTDPGTARPVARFAFTSATSQAAAEAMTTGMAELALAHLPEPGLDQRVLAAEALVVVAAHDNPLPAISTRDLARVLSGEIADWAALGGPAMPLVLHGLAPDAGFRAALEARLGQKTAATVEHPDLDALARAVARDPWGIAVTAASATGMARTLPLTDSCGFVLVPSRLSVKAGDYPLTQPFHLLTPRRRLPLVVRDFLDFLATPAADVALASSGVVDRGAEQVDLRSDGTRLANAIAGADAALPIAELQRLTAAMSGAARLSLTFRFEGGVLRLDATSLDSLAALVRLIGIGRFDGMEIVFAGFSDGSGDAAANLTLSRDRADAVREAVAAALTETDIARVRLSVDAFGETLPMACDESPVGRGINRRVEVWLRPVRDTPLPEN